MNRRHFLATTSAALAATILPSGTAFAAQDGVTFHFYGALDCPPCMAFKRNHLADVRTKGAEKGFAVEENIIPKTADVPTTGVYGARDPILRVAAQELTLAYPPIFFVSRNGQVTSVHAHDWQAALEAAITASTQG